MNFRIAALAGALVLGLGAAALAQSAPPTPPPVPTVTSVPAPITAVPTAAPTATPTPAGKRSKKAAPTPEPNASPTDTPEPPQFATMDGVWEVALQPPLTNRAIYSHLYITQAGDTLTGRWKREDNKTFLPFTGTFDGRLFKLTITDDANAKKTYTMSGYAENFGDMVGILVLDPTKDGTPFTASHRKKSKLEK